MPRNNPQHRRGKGNPKPRPKKHAMPTAVLSSTDIAALVNMEAHDDEVMYSTTVGHIPSTGHRSIPEPGHKVWAQYAIRP